jgi:nanoRNase/pAp phosphatase (c-di-AMP/oligoRNAs hydrolase)
MSFGRLIAFNEPSRHHRHKAYDGVDGAERRSNGGISVSIFFHSADKRLHAVAVCCNSTARFSFANSRAQSESVQMKRTSQAERLLKLADDKHKCLIVIQDMPDPDAIAAAEAIKAMLAQHRGIRSIVAYEGMVGRAENRGLLHYLDLDLALISTLKIDEFDFTCILDSQPQFTNNSFPADMRCNVVVDHHGAAEEPDADFIDVRPNYGATSTITTEYLRESNSRIDIRLAAALLYGIRSDKQHMVIDSSTADVRAFLYLYPLADKGALARIERERVSRDYFIKLHETLQACRIYNNALLCFVGETAYPEIVAEVADLVLRLENVDVVLAYGRHRNRLMLSLRTNENSGDAHVLMAELVKGIGSGGGHRMQAGGQIPLSGVSEKQAIDILEQRFLIRMNASDVTPWRLIPQAEKETVGSE